MIAPLHPNAGWTAGGFALLLLLHGVAVGHAQSSPDRPVPTRATADTTYFGQYHSPPKDTVSALAYDGFKQFQLNCSRCHGDFGVGTSFAPALTESLKPGSTIPTNELFVLTVCAGRPEKGMPAWCALGLEMEKIQAIYAYLSDRAAGRIGPGRPAVRRS